jgi:hypothetical protein
MIMSCCGKKRAQLNRARPTQAVTVNRAPAAAPIQNSAATPAAPAALASSPAPALFEYVGASSMTTMGAVTRKLYRFDGRGAKSAVDLRDAPALERVKELRRLA